MLQTQQETRSQINDIFTQWLTYSLSFLSLNQVPTKIFAMAAILILLSLAAKR